MTITASQVKDLRAKTGVGMMECKQALTKTNGDIDEAVKVLREKGLAKATKKSDRDTYEGRVFSVVTEDKKQASLVEMNCERSCIVQPTYVSAAWHS